MYTKQEASAQRQKFWTSFGKYMAQVPSSAGGKINWINYRTGIKSVNFKMDATAKEAYVAIEIFNKDVTLIERYYNGFVVLKSSFEETLNEEWQWQTNYHNGTGNTISRIFTVKENVNVFEETDWPEIISFFKSRIIAMDKFWNDHKEIFETFS
jgi:hypothetical protein